MKIWDYTENLLSCSLDCLPTAINIIKRGMITELNMASYQIENHPLKWQWPPYLEMDADIKVGFSYGELKKAKQFLKEEGLE